MLWLRALVGLSACICVSGVGQDTHNPLEHIQLFNAEDRLQHHHIDVTVNATAITGAAAWLEVRWSGVKHPSFDDWVGVVLAHSDVRKSTPIKYKLASLSPAHIMTGSGSTMFMLENHRHDVTVSFFLNGFKNPHLVGQSAPISFKHINRPSHGRLSLTGDPSEMLVQWTTANTKGGVVRWGRTPRNYEWTADARDLTYTREDMCGGAAAKEGWFDPGMFHYALLTGLEHGRKYFYSYGSEETGFSEEAWFRAAPATGRHEAVSIIALADMGQAEVDGSNEQSEMLPSANTTRWMLRDMETDAFSLVTHFGDISYARGHVSQWDRYHQQIEPLVTRLPYMIGIGNHERDWPESGDRFPSMTDSGGECGVAHERRFLMPSERQDEPWFDYTFGPVHFIHYSTEHVFHPGSKQHAFVKRALESVDRSRTPWVIFAGHRPFYIDSTNAQIPDGDQTVATALREAFEDLLLEHKVDLTLHGHHHSYQRTCPVYRGKCMGYRSDGTARAPVHLVIGNAGAGLCLNIHKRQPKIFEKIHLWWGYTRLHASETSLRVEAVSDFDGEVFDTLELRKPAASSLQRGPAHLPNASDGSSVHDQAPHIRGDQMLASSASDDADEACGA